MDETPDARENETVVPYQHARVPVERAALARDEWPEAFERRDHTRQRLREDAELVIEGDRIPVRLENLSARGVFLRSTTELRAGQQVGVCRGQDGPRCAVVVHRQAVARSLTGMADEGLGLLFLDEPRA